MARHLRVLGIIRVSKEGGRGDDLHSPEIQRTLISEAAARRGAQVVAWVEGIDESGSSTRSPWWRKLDEAVAAVEAGEYDGIIVKAFDRTARNRLKWNVALERIDACGGFLESATEAVDVTTAAGRFTRGMFGEMAAFRAEAIGEGWREVLDRRLSHGLPHNGRPRFGYVYDRSTGYTPHPEQGPILASMYAAYTSGSSDYAIAADLNRRGITTTTGGPWETTNIRRLLEGGFGAGFIFLEHRPKAGKRRTRDPEWLPGAHPPVITSDEWEAYRRARQGRKRRRPWAQKSTYLLSGIVKCGTCGGAMTAGMFGKNPVAMYRCDRWRGSGGQVCTANYVRCELVDAAVFEWLVDECADDIDATPVAEQRDDPRRQHEADAARHAAEAKRLDAALVRLVQQHAEDPESDELTFRKARDDYRERIRKANAAYDAAQQALELLAQPPSSMYAPLVDAWDTMTVEGRRDGLAALLRAVNVWSTGRGLPPKVEPVPRWIPEGECFDANHGKRPNSHHSMVSVSREQRTH